MMSLYDNIIQLLKHFVASPTDEQISYIPNDLKEIVVELDHRTNETRKKKMNVLILEYFNNSLNDYLNKKNSDKSIPKLLGFCKGIGEGLNFLFHQKVVHRDMILENILLDENDCPLICDFRMATMIDENGFSVVNEIGGNEYHLSPEVHNSYNMQKFENGEKSICYLKQPSFEFGLICFKILFGYHPFDKYPGLSYPVRVIDINREELIQKFGDIPIDVIDSITRLLKNDQDERPFIEDVLEYFSFKTSRQLI